MSIFLTLLYIAVAYLSPPALFGPIAEFHLEIILALAALLASIPNLSGSKFFEQPQTYVLACFSGCILISILLTGWAGGAVRALYSFFPSLFAFFLASINIRKISHLRATVAVLIASMAFIIFHGVLAVAQDNMLSDYVYAQSYDGGLTHVARIRGLTFINDPNDLSQVLVSLMPLTFFLWKKDGGIRNGLLVWVPVIILSVGMFFAHSRGAVLALVAVVLLALRRKIGTITASILAGLMFLVATAASWSGGGRDISMEAGADRFDAWYTGLQLIKSHPLFGVGYERFSDYYIITAHNSVVVCAAELGLIGYFFWILFIFLTTRRGVLLSASPEPVAIPEATESRTSRWAPMRAPVALNSQASDAITGPETESTKKWWTPAEADSTHQSEPEIRRLAWLLVIGLTGYLVAGWFLSRAYVATLFLYGGMMMAMLRMAREGGFEPQKDSSFFAMKWTFATAVLLLLGVSIILRLRGLGH